MFNIRSTSIAAAKHVIATALVVGTILIHAGQAQAVSLSVEYACMGDYFRYCSRHDPDGPGVRRCMNANGHKLSKTCVNALIKAGEVSQTEVDRRSSSKTVRAR